MKQIDESIFDEAGLKALSPEEKERMLGYVAKTLETRVGVRLATDATKQQLEEFTKLQDQGDDAKVLDWLEGSFTSFQTVVDEELAIIKTELSDMAEEVLKAR